MGGGVGGVEGVGVRRIELVLRRNLPAGVRHLLRLGRHLVVRGATSPPIPAALMQDCRVAASRYDLIKLLPAGGRIVEVGSFKGAVARPLFKGRWPSGPHPHAPA